MAPYDRSVVAIIILTCVIGIAFEGMPYRPANLAVRRAVVCLYLIIGNVGQVVMLGLPTFGSSTNVSWVVYQLLSPLIAAWSVSISFTSVRGGVTFLCTLWTWRTMLTWWFWESITGHDPHSKRLMMFFAASTLLIYVQFFFWLKRYQIGMFQLWADRFSFLQPAPTCIYLPPTPANSRPCKRLHHSPCSQLQTGQEPVAV